MKIMLYNDTVNKMLVGVGTLKNLSTLDKQESKFFEVSIREGATAFIKLWNAREGIQMVLISDIPVVSDAV